ncbi:MAG: hypothetical protein WCW54_03025 [Candidatus Paceibacterota bacterium]
MNTIYFSSLKFVTPLGRSKNFPQLMGVNDADVIFSFRNVTVSGDSEATYVFSVAGIDEKAVDSTISNVKRILSQHVMSMLKMDNLRYHLPGIKKTSYEFHGDWKKIVKKGTQPDTLYQFMASTEVPEVHLN